MWDSQNNGTLSQQDNVIRREAVTGLLLEVIAGLCLQIILQGVFIEQLRAFENGC